MNTYNENLQASVLNTLQRQRMIQQNIASSLNADLFTLYYAQGSVITCRNKINTSIKALHNKSAVKRAAINGSDLCTNLLTSATHANNRLKQSVTDIAVSAANVEVAANAILKLAGDTGSIFSILKAADFGAGIYNLANDAYNCINETAYAAEQASKLAMEASMLTAEVSGQTVLDSSNNASTSMAGLLNIVSNEFNDLSQIVAADNATLAAMEIKEKAAEGNFKSSVIDNKAFIDAYTLTNKELNLNLSVQQVRVVPHKEERFVSVSFNLLTSPFPKEGGRPCAPYPVQDYYIMVVKDQNKSMFSLSKAEAIAVNNTRQRMRLVGFDDTKPAGGTDMVITLDGPKVTGQFRYTDLEDSDGEPIKPGDNYVIFLVAFYAQDYKKKLNVFDEFLSAPSLPFRITQTLLAATNISASGRQVKYSFGTGMAKLRVMFLPVSDEHYKMLTNAAFDELMEKAADPEHDETSINPEQKAKGKKESTASFLFSVALAEQVAAGNYIPIAPEPPVTNATVEIKAGTTDNFGNLLVEGNNYLPVILTMPWEEGDSTAIPALSNLDITEPFMYGGQ